MPRQWPLLLVLIAALFLPSSAQNPQAVTVRIRAALFDHDLNLKPVPRLQVSLRSLDTPNAPPIELRTSLEGTAEVSLAPGKYQITTTANAELFGKSYRWDFPVTVSAANQLVELSNDNATTTDAPSRKAHVDELIEQFQRVRGAAAMVTTESSAHDGVLMDEAGLVLTTYIPPSKREWIAVSFDEKRSLPAHVVADDEKNDASVLHINMDKVKDIQAPLTSFDPGALVEGERVFSLNNDPKTGKSIRTGVVSKADEKAIITDVQFTDVGSPLFNSSGTLVGFSRVQNRAFTVVPLDAVREMIRTARESLKDSATLPPPRLLPVSPGKFPAQVLIERHDPKYERELYDFKVGDFNVYMGTPVSAYQWDKIRYEEQLKARMKRAAKGSQPDDIKEPDYECESILIVQARPDYKFPFWANMARTNRQPVVIRPKTSFHHMRLLCDDHEVEPIRPLRFTIRAPENAGFVLDQDSMMGKYDYTPDSLPPSCGTVTLEIYSAEQPTTPIKKVIENPLRDRLWKDFEPFRSMQAREHPAAPQPDTK
ncbi:MAG TPA: serine protease [Terracidiphilus sp.]|nr:serine protease [Terracidiphilus sp.]